MIECFRIPVELQLDDFKDYYKFVYMSVYTCYFGSVEPTGPKSYSIWLKYKLGCKTNTAMSKTMNICEDFCFRIKGLAISSVIPEYD